MSIGLEEETGLPGGNPSGTGRAYKHHTDRTEAGIKPWTYEANMLSTMLKCSLKVYLKKQLRKFNKVVKKIRSRLRIKVYTVYA